VSGATREQLRVCGELTDYSADEIEVFINSARATWPRADDSTIFGHALEAMKEDLAYRALNEAKVSIGEMEYEVEPC
jgi:hypothetical protein